MEGPIISNSGTRRATRSEPTEKALFWLLAALAIALPLAFFPWANDPTGIPKVTILRMGAAAALFIWALGGIIHGRLAIPGGLLAACLAAFMSLVTLSTFFSIDLPVSVFGRHLGYMGLWTLLSLGIIAASGWVALRSPTRRRDFALIATGGAAIVSLLALLNSLGVYSYVWDSGPQFGSRGYATLGNPDFLGLYLVPTFGLALGVLLGDSSTAQRRITAVFSLLIAAGIVSSGSAGAFAGATAVALTLGAAYLLRRRAEALPGKKTTRTVLLVLTAAAATVVLGVIAFTVLQSKQQSASLRLLVWPAALSVIADHPLLGTGPDALHYELPTNMRFIPGPHNRTTPEDAHNYFLTLAASTGIPALLAFLVLVIFAVGTLLRRDGADVRGPPSGRLNTDAGAAAAIVGYLVTASFNPDDLGGALIFWILVGWCGGVAGSLRVARTSVWGRAAAIPALIVSLPLLVLPMLPLAADAYSQSVQSAVSAPDAIARADRAIALAPFDEWYLRRKTALLLDLSGSDRRYLPLAQQSADQFIDLAPLEPVSHVYAGVAASMSPNDLSPQGASASDHLKKALTLNPNNPDALYFLYQIEKENGRTRAAEEYGRHYLKLELGDERSTTLQQSLKQR